MGNDKRPPGLLIYFDTLPFLDQLSDAQSGRLFKAIIRYGQDEISPDFDDDQALSVIWAIIGPKIDRDKNHYVDVSEARRKASREYWAARAKQKDSSEPRRDQMDSFDSKCDQMDSLDSKCDQTINYKTKNLKPKTLNDNSSEDMSSQNAPTKTKKFVPPSVSEVKSYCDEHGYSVDPEQFVDYYAARNWFAGKTKVKNWQACLRTWQRREPERPLDITSPETYSYCEGSL